MIQIEAIEFHCLSLFLDLNQSFSDKTSGFIFGL